MYLSRLIVHNFRSIKDLDLHFSPSKNILIGHNNAGKSNIVRAINIILSEQSPDYKKFENITERDFHGHSNYLYIVGFISKRDGENNIDFNELEYSRKASFITLIDTGEYNLESRIENLIEKCKNTDFDSMERVYDKDFSALEEGERLYVDLTKDSSGQLDDQKTLALLSNTQSFIYIFTAEKHDSIIEKSLYLVLKTKDGNYYLAQYPFIRTELITSAIIPSFRDPNIQLKPTAYSWFGKLMKHKIEEAKTRKQSNNSTEQELGDTKSDPFEEIKEAQNKIREHANRIFEDVIEDIKSNSLKIGFGNADISFSFAGDDMELHKSVKVFINDGIESPIEDKGAGIQSAVLISLFSYYVRNYLSQSHALLCLEEPEIYLHPHACRALNKSINSFVSQGNNQVILTTHNHFFVKLDDNESGKIIKVHKDESLSTRVCELEITKDVKNLFIRDENLELLFAKKVILTEGLEKYIIKMLWNYYSGDDLDLLNISVISGEGKTSFPDFVKVCQKLDIDVFIMADFDFFLRGLESLKEFVREKLGPTNFRYLETLWSKLGENYKDFKDKGKRLEDFPDRCSDLYRYMQQGLDRLRKVGIFILNGEAEDIFNEDQKSEILVNGKLKFESIIKLREKLIEEKIDPNNIFSPTFLSNLEEFVNVVSRGKS